MKKPTFAEVFFGWLVLDLICIFINVLTVRSDALARIANASLGVFLLILPIYPPSFAQRWDEEECKLAIRVIAVGEVIVSLISRPFYL